MEALVDAISGSFLQEGSLWALSTIPGFPPIIQTVHIIGIAVVMGSAFLLSLRLLGLAIPSQNLTELSQRCLPWFWIAVASNIFSGAFFVLGRPARYFNNPVFTTKMALLILLIAVMLAFYLLHKRQEAYWEQPNRKWHGRAIALTSIGLILMICTCGRWIAYTEYLDYPLWYMEPYFDGSEYPFWVAIENWGLSQIIAATNWFPTLETIHVIAASLVLGSILWVDIRLLGFAATRYPITTLSKELVPWTWGAFVIATITGLGMFITRASSHIDNPAFQWKLALLALAGVNMAYFHRKVYPQISQWDDALPTTAQLKTIGASSLFLWCGVMLAGRWVGHIV